MGLHPVNWNWKKVLSDLRRFAHPPQLIVTSRTADDYLWAEVLNIGGYDVLPQGLWEQCASRAASAAGPMVRSAHIRRGAV